MRSKESVGTGKKLEKTVSLADRMKSNISHSVEQHKEQSSAESSPNQYADSTAREGFDRITHEGGHLVISSSQDAYHMGVNLYKRHQAQKQSETQQEYPPTDTPEWDSQTIPDEPVTNASTVSEHHMTDIPESSSATPQSLPDGGHFSEAHNYPRTKEVPDVKSPHTASYDAGKQYAQRSSQERLRTVRGKVEDKASVDDIRMKASPERSVSIPTKGAEGFTDTAPCNTGSVTSIQSPVEAGRALAKKEAHKRSIEKQKQTAHISVSTEVETPNQSKSILMDAGAIKQEPVNKTAGVLKKTSDSVPTAVLDPISSKDTQATVKPIGRTATKVARGKEIKKAGSAVRSAERSVKGTDIATKEMVRVAKNNLVKAKRAEQIRVAAQAAASAAKKAGSALSKAAKAIAEAAKELIAALAAGGGMTLLVVVILVVVGAAGLMLASDENDSEVIPVSDEVKAYEPLIRQYAKKYGIGDYVLLIEAVMMQESGGRTTDPMQCSECNFNTRYPHTPGSITDPEYSIEVGIQNLTDCLFIAGAEGPLDIDHIKLAIQGYNYGQGYITWALNKYGEYSKANAVEFSMKTAEQVGWNSYGDMDYVPHVLRYYPLGQLFYDPDGSSSIVEVAYSQIGNVGGDPYWSWYGFSNHVEWCACFVSWCADQCGYLDAGIIPKFSGCVLGINWFKEHGQWQSNTYEPAPGDLIFFDWNKAGVGQDGISDHVGIVQKVENGRVYTIEGNSSDMCRERSYTIGNYQIMGYGVPAY